MFTSRFASQKSLNVFFYIGLLVWVLCLGPIGCGTATEDTHSNHSSQKNTLTSPNIKRKTLSNVLHQGLQKNTMMFRKPFQLNRMHHTVAGMKKVERIAAPHHGELIYLERSRKGIYAFDRVRKESRLLIRLDAPTMPKDIEDSFRLSPDRKSIVLIGTNPLQKSLNDHRVFSKKSIWIVHIPTQKVRLIAAQIPVPTSIPGTVFTQSLQAPQWSFDGFSIWFQQVSTWYDLEGHKRTHHSRIQVNISTREWKRVELQVPHCETLHFVEHPSESKTILYNKDCFAGMIFMHDANKNTTQKIELDENVDILGSVTWSKQQIVFHGTRIERGQTKKHYIFALNLVDGSLKVLFTVRDNVRVTLSTSKDARLVLVGVQEKMTTKAHSVTPFHFTLIHTKDSKKTDLPLSKSTISAQW